MKLDPTDEATDSKGHKIQLVFATLWIEKRLINKNKLFKEIAKIPGVQSAEETH